MAATSFVSFIVNVREGKEFFFKYERRYQTFQYFNKPMIQ